MSKHHHHHHHHHHDCEEKTTCCTCHCHRHKGKDRDCKDNEPFYEGCECDWGVDGCNTLGMLKRAMAMEIKAARKYRYLAEMAKCESDKELFLSLRADEKRHFRLLQEIYRDLTCCCYPAPRVRVKRPKNICTGIKKAICDEMKDVEFYESLANCLTEMQHKEIVLSILNDEREHAQQLAALYRIYQECACKAAQNNNTCCCCTTCCSCGSSCGCGK